MTDATLAPEVLAYYERGGETDRLSASPRGLIEYLRTRDVLERLIGSEPRDVLDVGGATGVHAEWLARAGHRVTLIDPVASHVAAAATLPGVTARVGDARALPVPDGAYDAVLLLGPLYHLQSEDERVAALHEAVRAARPGGLVAAATINRFSAWHDHLRRGMLTAPGAPGLLDEVLASGRLLPHVHGADTGFTTAYLHRPEQITAEFAQAGLPGADVYALEGAAWLAESLGDTLDGDASRTALMDGLRLMEREESLRGVSSHLLTVAHTPA